MKPKSEEKNKEQPTIQRSDLSLEVDQGAAFYELQHRELQIKRLKAKAEKLGYRITPIPAAA